MIYTRDKEGTLVHTKHNIFACLYSKLLKTKSLDSGRDKGNDTASLFRQVTSSN